MRGRDPSGGPLPLPPESDVPAIARERRARAEYFKRLFRDVQDELVLLTGEWRIGQELLREEQKGLKSVGGRPKTGFLEERVSLATLAEKVGNRTYGWRLSRQKNYSAAPNARGQVGGQSVIKPSAG